MTRYGWRFGMADWGLMNGPSYFVQKLGMCPSLILDEEFRTGVEGLGMDCKFSPEKTANRLLYSSSSSSSGYQEAEKPNAAVPCYAFLGTEVPT